MKFSKRQVEILQYLNAYQKTTVKQMSQKIGVTAQTIKSELTALEKVLGAYNITVEFQSGKGIKVYGSNNLERLLKISEMSIEFSVQNQVVLLLLLNRDFLILQDIADELFISKSQIEKLMPAIMKEYGDTVVSIRHYGYKYNGTELERRKLFVKLMDPYMQELDLAEKFKLFNETQINLTKYFTSEIIDKTLKAIDYILTSGITRFTDQAIQRFFLYLILILYNNENDEEVMSADFLEGIKVIDDFKCYQSIAEIVNKQALLELKDKEKDYLIYVLLILKKQRTQGNDKILEDMRGSIKEVLERIKYKLGMDLSKDKDLIEGLSYHLYSSILINRFCKYTYENNDLNNIKGQYPLGYEMATITGCVMHDHFNYAMRDCEMVYVALHFQTAIERHKQDELKVKTVVVCQFGQAACQLIKVKVERYYPEIQVIGTYSVQEFLALDDEQYELIITSAPLPQQSSTTLYVTPALKEVELGRIREVLKTRSTGLMIEEQIERAKIIEIQIPSSKEEVISKMVAVLEEEDCVSAEYLESVYQREQVSSTAMQYIAVPHGAPELVKETRLVVARLKPSISWGEEEVGCAFLLTVTSEGLRENPYIFASFYKKIAQLEFEVNLKALEDVSEQTFRKELIKLFK